MRIKTLIFSGLMVAVLSANALAIDTLGSLTTPQSSRTSGLSRSPSSFANNGNRIITGNVGGGKHFRGFVPYNSATDFGGNLGSASLDSFLRYSQPNVLRSRSPGTFQPFYSAGGTVTRTIPGQRRIETPVVSPYGVRGYRARFPKTEQTQFNISESMRNAYKRQRPFSQVPEDVFKDVTLPMSSEKQFKEIVTDSEEFEKAKQRAAEMVRQMQEKAETEDGDTLSKFKILPPKTLDKEHLIEPFKAEDMTEQFIPKTKVDVYQQMQEQTEELNKLLQAQAEAKEAVEAETDEDVDVDKDEDKDKDERPKPDDKFERILLEAQAENILGKHKTFASYSRDKFNYHMRQAEERLKQGQYYRAADSYTMANMYKPNDPLAFAGKSHALFAAGEYLSSALYLARAIEAFPEYVMFKVDLEAMIPDKDALENRIIEAVEWHVKSDSAELQFLLSYVYYQLDEIAKAKETINLAIEKMPESKAAAILKMAIDNAGK